MVIQGVVKEESIGGAERVMAMGPNRSKQLHNFELPTTWRNQKFLRCIKVDSPGTSAGFDFSQRSRSSTPSESDYVVRFKRVRDRDSELETKQRSPNTRLKIKHNGYGGADNHDDGGIDAVREKLMLDLKIATDNMKFSMFKQGGEKDEPMEERVRSVPCPAPAVAEKPWTLRTRRTVSKSPIMSEKKNGKFEENKASESPTRNENPVKSSRLRGLGHGGEKKQKTKLSIPLSRKDIEEDYLKLFGHRPPRRPNKRDKSIQKDLDIIFPASWLTQVTADMYKVS